MEEAPQSHSTAKKKALIRDGYRCVISGMYDAASIEADIPAAVASAAAQPTPFRVIETHLAHIFPPSTNENLESEAEGGPKREYAAGVWAVMERLGLVNGFLELNGSQIHRLENVMTLGSDVHPFFDRLKLWFEPSPTVANTYHLRSIYPHIITGLPATVTFTSPDPTRLPLPDSRYLALHAACARVVHLSGAAEYIEKMYRSLEDTKVLASNGSSADTLLFALEERFAATA